MVVEMLTSEDEHFRNGICNDVEKLCRHIIGIISELIPYIVAISSPITLIRFVRLGVKIV